MLLFMYLVPFIVSVAVVLYFTIKKYEDVNRSPYYLKLKHIILLTVLNIAAILADYTAVFTYHSLYQSY
jgi:hypothetical protein